MDRPNHKMWTNRRISVIVTLIIIMIIGAYISLTNKRPKSNRKKDKTENVEVKEDFKKINYQIDKLTDSIGKNPNQTSLILQRARLLKSVNKFDEAILDYEKFLKKATDYDDEIEKELEAVIKVRDFVIKQKE